MQLYQTTKNQSILLMLTQQTSIERISLVDTSALVQEWNVHLPESYVCCCKSNKRRAWSPGNLCITCVQMWPNHFERRSYGVISVSGSTLIFIEPRGPGKLSRLWEVYLFIYTCRKGSLACSGNLVCTQSQTLSTTHAHGVRRSIIIPHR